MRRKLTRLVISIFALTIAVTALLTPATQPTQAVMVDCGVVNQVCDHMGEMMYNLCVINGGNDCATVEANYRISCKTNNGCPPGGN